MGTASRKRVTDYNCPAITERAPVFNPSNREQCLVVQLDFLSGLKAEDSYGSQADCA
jgi:hypothetical protein